MKQSVDHRVRGEEPAEPMDLGAVLEDWSTMMKDHGVDERVAMESVFMVASDFETAEEKGKFDSDFCEDLQPQGTFEEFMDGRTGEPLDPAKVRDAREEGRIFIFAR